LLRLPGGQPLPFVANDRHGLKLDIQTARRTEIQSRVVGGSPLLLHSHGMTARHVPFRKGETRWPCPCPAEDSC
jgi:hypothetical protein